MTPKTSTLKQTKTSLSHPNRPSDTQSTRNEPDKTNRQNEPTERHTKRIIYTKTQSPQSSHIIRHRPSDIDHPTQTIRHRPSDINLMSLNRLKPHLVTSTYYKNLMSLNIIKAHLPTSTTHIIRHINRHTQTDKKTETPKEGATYIQTIIQSP